MTAILSYPDVPQPTDRDSAIWRYMSAEEFEQIVAERRIHLTQIARFDDTFEGSMPREAKERIDYLYRKGGVDPRSVTEATYPSYRARHWHYASCWCVLEHEHDGLWKTYGEVAVRSSFRNLVDQFDHDAWATSWLPMRSLPSIGC